MAQFAVWKLQIINHLWLLRYFTFPPLGVTKSPTWIDFTLVKGTRAHLKWKLMDLQSTLKDCSLHMTAKVGESESWVWLLWFNFTSSSWTGMSCQPAHLRVFLSAFYLPGTSSLFLSACPLVVAGLAAGLDLQSVARLNLSSRGVWTSTASCVTSPKNTTAARLRLST